ncbi:hypothetical protein IW262DRAFT_1498880 [Armillaria fumosa]|nr:hypothetical protein IW262DRAFT_1498880 [Armillaria fumosa]
MISPPRTLSNVLRYIVGFIIATVILMSPTILTRFPPFPASDGDLAHTLPSSTVGTSASIVSPTKWAIITMLFSSVIASRVNRVHMLNPLLLPTAPFSLHSRATETALFRRQRTNASRRTVSTVLVIIALTLPLQRLIAPTILDFSTHNDSFQASNSHINHEAVTAGKVRSTRPSQSTNLMGSFQHSWCAHRAQVSESKGPAVPTTSRPSTVVLCLQDIAISHHAQMPYEQRRHILTSGSKRSKEGIFENGTGGNTKKSAPGQALWGAVNMDN